MMEMAEDGWRSLRELAPWFFAEALLPGVALFALLLWLSQRFVLEGFSQVRQYAFAPTGDKVSVKALAQRNWWSCTCVASCACLSTIVQGLRRCCLKAFSKPGAGNS